MAQRRVRRGSLAANFALAAGALVVSLLLVEAACQGVAHFLIFPRFDRDMAKPNFFLVRSDDPVLAYENRPGFETVTPDGKVMRINRDGLRADGDDRFDGQHKIAMLGDSVTIGAGHSQDRTIEALLEERVRAAGREARVLNFGVPGYATRELLQYLMRKDALYDVAHVLYLLNPNDFARRDSVYEGGDNGVYRMFVRPAWQTPWFVRKAVYRLHKDDEMVGWYQWLFAGNEPLAQADIRAMAAHCRESGAGFSVVLLPSGHGYAERGYRLAELYGRMARFLDAEGIPQLAPIEAFADDPQRYFDETDHLWDAGNERMAEVLHAFLERIGALGPPRVGASAGTHGTGRGLRDGR